MDTPPPGNGDGQIKLADDRIQNRTGYPRGGYGKLITVPHCCQGDKALV